MNVMEASSSSIVGPVTEAAARYAQLTASERFGAEYLETFCRAAGTHNATARELSNRSLIQAICSGVPLALTDFLLMWVTTYIGASIATAISNASYTPTIYQPAWIAGRHVAPVSRFKGVAECQREIERMVMPAHDPTAM